MRILTLSMCTILHLWALPSLAANPIKLHDPLFYNVVEKNSVLDCRYNRDENFGFLLQTNAENITKVFLITNNASEGEKSAFIPQNIFESVTDILLQHKYRKEMYGTYVELKFDRRRDMNTMNFLASAAMTDVIYSKNADGSEKENLYLNGFYRMSCKKIL